jgi:hypothetical protein
MWQFKKFHIPKRKKTLQVKKKYSTTNQQPIPNAKTKKQPPSTPDSLMMSIAATSSSIYSKN